MYYACGDKKYLHNFCLGNRRKEDFASPNRGMEEKFKAVLRQKIFGIESTGCGYGPVAGSCKYGMNLGVL
jgi:hypothetical protein